MFPSLFNESLLFSYLNNYKCLFDFYNQFFLFYHAVETQRPSRILSTQQWTKKSLLLNRRRQPYLCLPKTKTVPLKDLLIQRYIMLRHKRKRQPNSLVKGHLSQQMLVWMQRHAHIFSKYFHFNSLRCVLFYPKNLHCTTLQRINLNRSLRLEI